MGLVHAEIELANVRDDALAPMTVTSLVDSGALHLCIPQHVANQLELDVFDKREVRTADSAPHMVDYVGPIRVRYANRQCFVGALVLGDETLLGAIPMKDMDLIVSPARRQLVVNPANPNVAGTVAIGFRTEHAQ
jgi:clan AA aspartic protease